MQEQEQEEDPEQKQVKVQEQVMGQEPEHEQEQDATLALPRLCVGSRIQCRAQTPQLRRQRLCYSRPPRAAAKVCVAGHPHPAQCASISKYLAHSAGHDLEEGHCDGDALPRRAPHHGGSVGSLPLRP